MRLLALLLALAATPSAAQSPGVPNQTDLQQLDAWAQRLVAAQQPIIDVNTRCTPVMQAMANEAGRPAPAISDKLANDMSRCVTDMTAAAERAAAGLNAMEPLPASIEQLLNIDSKSVLTRSAEATRGMVTYLVRVNEMLAAAKSGNQALVRSKWGEARRSAGSATDASIAILQAVRASLPTATNKAMVDIRIGILRAARAMAMIDPSTDLAGMEKQIRQHAGEIRAASTQMRSSWRTESEPLRAMSNNPAAAQYVAMLPSMDTAVERVAAASDGFLKAVDGIPPGAMTFSDVIKLAQAAGGAEIAVVQAAASMGTAVSQ